MCSRLHLQILRQLLDGPATPYALIPNQDGTLSEFYDSIQELKQRGWCNSNEAGELLLSSSGKLLAEKSTSSITNLVCTSCNGRGYSHNLASTEFLNRYKQVLKDRPAPCKEYDQQAITPENVVLRASFMDSRGDVADKNILIIGDDDMLGLALALSGLPNRVVVLEVDTRVNEFVNRMAKEHGLRLKAYNFDVRAPFPQKFMKKFDVFNCDPVETVEGIKLFLSAGITALKGKGSICYFGLTTLEAGTSKWYKIQQLLLDMNLVVTDIKRNFNEYECTDFDNTFMVEKKFGDNTEKHAYYWSALWRTEAVREPKPAVVISGKQQLSFDIYRDEETWATPLNEEVVAQ